MAETVLIVAERVSIISAGVVTVAFIGSFVFLLIAAVVHR